MSKNIYDLLNLDPKASKQDIYNAVLDYVKKGGKNSKKWNDIKVELEKYVNLGSKDAYDAQLSTFDKENAELFSIVNRNHENNNSYSRDIVIDKKSPFDYKHPKDDDLSKKIKKLKKAVIIGLVVTIGVSGMIGVLKGCSKEVDIPETSTTQNYIDEESEQKVEKETINYKIESGDFTKDNIAERLEISSDECELLGSIGQAGTYVSIRVPEDVAEKYNYKNLSKDHFICYYETGDFDSLLEVSKDIIEEYPAFSEGKEYNENGRTPANYLADCLIEDNPNMGESLRSAQAGTYKLNFYGTDEEYDTFVKEGKLPQTADKTLN